MLCLSDAMVEALRTEIATEKAIGAIASVELLRGLMNEVEHAEKNLMSAINLTAPGTSTTLVVRAIKAFQSRLIALSAMAIRLHSGDFGE